MPMLTAASTIVSSPLLPAGQCPGRLKLSSCGPKRVCGDGRMVHFKIKPVGLGAQLSLLEKRKPVIGSRRSASVICASASNARCGAEQTQTVTREAPTITHLPGKEKSPLLDDGGSGFPPGDDGDGGGGGGGGGGNWSGGFAFFGFLLFLSFLKDKESEGGYRENRRR
ncbi:protein YELLOW LEAF 1, choloroplastic-like isoform X2 [Prunus dulcis]|uniref:protein YELLOW LEAF 1, choloroplastic-like isoform X2 n=1 Tax=Prunus dulcis TaxID=3755 RepID=UPI001482BC1C|nr:protein YELLOW LEAF 1, choloroplastic-like isoform X2 [Prunus dulcis]